VTTEGARRVRIGAALVLTYALIAAASIATAAEPGGTTPYGPDGIAHVGLGDHYLETAFTKVTARADGGLVAERKGEIETFLPDGALDPAAPPVAVPKGRTVFPGAAGKSLILGKETLTRLNADGTLDTTFGGDGTVKSPLYYPGLVFELGSGTVVEVGTELVGTNRPMGQIEVAVLEPDGTLVRSGRRGDLPGVSAFELPTVSEFALHELIPTSAGGALIVDEACLLELNPDGTVDTGFGKGGFVYGTGLASAHFRPDGSIEAFAAAYGPAETRDLELLSLTAAGEPEAAFGPKGARLFDLGGRIEATTASWAADGSVVVAGNKGGSCSGAGRGCATEPFLAAFDPSGNLETGYGDGGVLLLTGLAGDSAAYEPHGAIALTRRPDGAVVLAGSAPPDETVAFLAAVSPAGQLIPTFGEAGIVRVRAAVAAGQELAGMAGLHGGGLIATGTSELGAEERVPVLIRYTADGTLDPAFGGGAGYVTIGPSGERVTGFASRGKEVLTGLEGPERLLMIDDSSGRPVARFGNDGSVALPKDAAYPLAMLISPDGDPIVLAERRGSHYEKSEVLRFLPDGRLDRRFGNGGRVQLRTAKAGAVYGSSLAFGAGGSLLVGGRVGEERLALGKLLGDGRLDRHFGSRGWSLVRAGGPIETVLATPDRNRSHFYFAASVGDEERHQIELLRFDRGGHLDRGFGHRGRLTAGYERSAGPRLIVPRRNGALVAVSIGIRPLLTFSSGHKVKRRSPGAQTEFVRELRGTVSGGSLALAWSAVLEDGITDSSYLSKGPLVP
jgi:uncharacterized delta-60 repeat protein